MAVRTLGDLLVRIGADSSDYEKKLRMATRQMDKFGRKMQSIGRQMTQTITLPLALVGGAALKSAADMETLEASFATLTGSADKARKIMKDLADFTARTPFQLQDVASTGRQLLAFGFSIDEMSDSLQFLGDIAAGTNSNLGDLALILGQARAIGAAYTMDLRQLANRGIPIFDILKERLNLTGEELSKFVSDGKVSFEILRDALKSTAQEGGLFAGGMERQSKTLNGIFSTLRDNVVLFMAEMGKEIAKTLDLRKLGNQIIAVLGRMTAAFKSLNPETKKFLIWAGVIAAALGPAIAAIGTLTLVMKSLLLVSLPLVAKITAIVAAIAGLALVVRNVVKVWEKFEQFWENLTDNLLLTWKEMVLALKTSLIGIAATIDSIFGSSLTKALAEDIVELGEEIEDLKAKNPDLISFGDVLGAVMDGIGNDIQSVIDLFKDLGTAASTVMGGGGAGGGGGPAVPTISGGPTGTIGQLGTPEKKGPIITEQLRELTDAAIVASGAVQESTEQISSSFAEMLTSGGASLKAFGKMVLQVLTGVIKKIIAAIIAATVLKFILGSLIPGFGGGLPAFGDLFKNLSGLASFASGTDFVPRDMIAKVHKGEAIVPAHENRKGRDINLTGEFRIRQRDLVLMIAEANKTEEVST